MSYFVTTSIITYTSTGNSHLLPATSWAKVFYHYSPSERCFPSRSGKHLLARHCYSVLFQRAFMDSSYFYMYHHLNWFRFLFTSILVLLNAGSFYVSISLSMMYDAISSSSQSSNNMYLVISLLPAVPPCTPIKYVYELHLKDICSQCSPYLSLPLWSSAVSSRFMTHMVRKTYSSYR